MTPDMPFSFSCKTDVHFGVGSHRKLIDLLPQGTRSVVLVKGVSDAASAPVRALLSSADIAVSTIICAGEPSIASVNAAWHGLAGTAPEAIIVCGGGSAIDTGKALLVALHKAAPLSDDDFSVSHRELGGRPLIVLPTTAGTGSEVTSNAVLGAQNREAKISLRGQGLQPTTAIVDPDLMRGAPKAVVLHAGLDAVVQNIEAYTSAFATPFTRALAGPAVASTLVALRAIMDADDTDAWSTLAWGSLSSGLALANGGLGAVHGVASILGAALGAPHGALCGRLLVPVLRANLASAACTTANRRDIVMCQQAIAEVFTPVQVADPLSGFAQWLDGHGLPRLADWGLHTDQIDTLAQASQGASSSLKNVVKLDAQDLGQVLREAL